MSLSPNPGNSSQKSYSTSIDRGTFPPAIVSAEGAVAHFLVSRRKKTDAIFPAFLWNTKESLSSDAYDQWMPRHCTLVPGADGVDVIAFQKDSLANVLDVSHINLREILAHDSNPLLLTLRHVPPVAPRRSRVRCVAESRFSMRPSAFPGLDLAADGTAEELDDSALTELESALSGLAPLITNSSPPQITIDNVDEDNEPLPSAPPRKKNRDGGLSAVSFEFQSQESRTKFIDALVKNFKTFHTNKQTHGRLILNRSFGRRVNVSRKKAAAIEYMRTQIQPILDRLISEGYDESALVQGVWDHGSDISDILKGIMLNASKLSGNQGASVAKSSDVVSVKFSSTCKQFSQWGHKVMRVSRITLVEDFRKLLSENMEKPQHVLKPYAFLTEKGAAIDNKLQLSAYGLGTFTDRLELTVDIAMNAAPNPWSKVMSVPPSKKISLKIFLPSWPGLREMASATVSVEASDTSDIAIRAVLRKAWADGVPAEACGLQCNTGAVIPAGLSLGCLHIDTMANIRLVFLDHSKLTGRAVDVNLPVSKPFPAKPIPSISVYSKNDAPQPAGPSAEDERLAKKEAEALERAELARQRKEAEEMRQVELARLQKVEQERQRARDESKRRDAQAEADRKRKKLEKERLEDETVAKLRDEKLQLRAAHEAMEESRALFNKEKSEMALIVMENARLKANEKKLIEQERKLRSKLKKSHMNKAGERLLDEEKEIELETNIEAEEHEKDDEGNEETESDNAGDSGAESDVTIDGDLSENEITECPEADTMDAALHLVPVSFLAKHISQLDGDNRQELLTVLLQEMNIDTGAVYSDEEEEESESDDGEKYMIKPKPMDEDMTQEEKARHKMRRWLPQDEDTNTAYTPSSEFDITPGILRTLKSNLKKTEPKQKEEARADVDEFWLAMHNRFVAVLGDSDEEDESDGDWGDDEDIIEVG